MATMEARYPTQAEEIISPLLMRILKRRIDYTTELTEKIVELMRRVQRYDVVSGWMVRDYCSGRV